MANTRTTSSRTPTTSRATPRTGASRRASEPEQAEEHTGAADAQEIETVNKHVTALLCGEEVRIIPPGAWRQSWQRVAAQGQVDAFARIVVHPDDFDLYVEIDPTNEEWGEFITDAAEQAGEGLGKSSGPAPSSRRTRRR